MEEKNRMTVLAEKLLDRLEGLVENGEPDYATIKQICATMKDLKELVQPAGKSGGVTVTLGEAVDKLSQ